jgi:hypothetical protein
VPLDDEVEPDLEDLVVTGAGVRMREGVPRHSELLEQAAGDRDVEPAELSGEGLDLRRLRASGRGAHHIWDGALARSRFFRLHTGRTAP